MYLRTVKGVLDRALASYLARTGADPTATDAEIASHIRDTSREHRNPDPDINYDDPLCRLGYLFVHAGANGYLFEKAIMDSSTLVGAVQARGGATLRVCAVGGGPGTEMLGVTGLLLRDPTSAPARIDFTVMDRVNEWAETWSQIATACETLLRPQHPRLVFSPQFLSMDVDEPESFERFAWHFAETDVVVYNYLVSENQVRLENIAEGLGHVVNGARPGTAFVVIDRLELELRDNVEKMLGAIPGLIITEQIEIGGCMPDSESDLEPYVERFGRRPRRWFRTYETRRPTVFATVAVKQ